MSKVEETFLDYFKDCFLSWVSGLKLANNEVIAIDGKTLLHSFDNANNKAAIHMVGLLSLALDIKLVASTNVNTSLIKPCFCSCCFKSVNISDNKLVSLYHLNFP